MTATSLWEVAGLPDHDVATVLAATDRHASPLKARYPHIVVPGSGLTGYCRPGRFTTWSLVTLWREAAEWFTGACPCCGGAVRGTSAGGMLTIGGICGYCLACGLPLKRALPGIVAVLSVVPAKVVRRTVPVSSNRRRAALIASPSPWQPLLAALDTLGERNLPIPTASAK